MIETKENKLMIIGSLASTGTALCLAVLKFFAFVMTGSVAILSSLFDSVQDFMTSLINLIAVHQAIQPADKAHRFGHGKAQGIGGLLQAFIIAASSVLLLIESISHLIHKEPIQHIEVAFIVTGIAVVVTLLLVRFQNYVVRLTNSLSMKADKAHYTGDVLMNGGVIISLCGSVFFNWDWLDGLFGILVSIYLFWAVWTVMAEACAMLMDKELPQEMRTKIRSLALSVPMVKNISGLKTRQSGNNFFIQFNAEFDGKLSLASAHAQLDKIEDIILATFPKSEIIIHAEPYQIEGKKHHDKI